MVNSSLTLFPGEALLSFYSSTERKSEQLAGSSLGIPLAQGHLSPNRSPITTKAMFTNSLLDARHVPHT